MAQVMEPTAPNKQTPQTQNSRTVGPTGLAGIRSGVVLRGCECNKRNGLTHDCRCGFKNVRSPVLQGQTNQPCPPTDGKNAAGDQIYCQQPEVTPYQHAQGDGTGNMQMQTMHMQNQAHMGNNSQYANYVPNSYQGLGNSNQQVVCDPAVLNQQQNPQYTNQIQGGYAQSNLPMQNADANAYNNPHSHTHHVNTNAGMPNNTPLLNQNNPTSNEIRPCEHMMTAGQTNVCPPNMIQNNQAANMQHTCGAHPNSMVCAQNLQNHIHNAAEQVPNSVMHQANQQFAQGNYNIANAMKTMAEQPFPIAQNQSTLPSYPHQQNQIPNQNAYLANHNPVPGQMYQQHTAAQDQVSAVHQNAQINPTNQSQIHHMHTGYENQYPPCEHHHPQGTMPQVTTGANNTQAMNYPQNTMAQFPNNQYYQNQQGMQGNTGYLNPQQGNSSPNQQQITNSAGFQNYQGHQQINSVANSMQLQQQSNAVANNMQLQQQTNAVANNMQQGHFGMAHPGYSNAMAPTV